MAFLVWEEKSFSTAVLFNSTPAFLASSSQQRMGLQTEEDGSGAAIGILLVINLNHLGSTCGVLSHQVSIATGKLEASEHIGILKYVEKVFEKPIFQALTKIFSLFQCKGDVSWVPEAQLL